MNVSKKLKITKVKKMFKFTLDFFKQKYAEEQQVALKLTANDILTMLKLSSPERSRKTRRELTRTGF
jgi:hypothetical protein